MQIYFYVINIFAYIILISNDENIATSSDRAATIGSSFVI